MASHNPEDVRAEGSPEDLVGLMRGEQPLVNNALLQVIKSKCVMKVDAKRKLLMNLSKKNPSNLFSNAFSVRREDVAALSPFFRASSYQEKQRWNATLCAQKLLQLHGMVMAFESSELAE
jgi:hypothetical protein